MIVFLEIVLRLQIAHILPLDSWKVPESPDAATKCNFQHCCIGRVAITIAYF